MLKLVLLSIVVLLFGLVFMYNSKILSILEKYTRISENIFYNYIGKRIRRWNTQLERKTTLKKRGLIYRFNNYYKDIIVNLGMTKDDVTTVGLLVFISSVSFVFALCFWAWSGEFILIIPSFLAIFYFITIVFRFVSLMRYEKKEEEIMDTVDLLSMDIKGGVYNAILKYRKSLHPNVRPYFEEFIDNIQNKGYSFKSAMLRLNDQLGVNFTDFAQKAILYEEKADDNMDDIFSSLVEINRYRRTLRYENNQKFSQLRLEFLISVGIIAVYAVFVVWQDPFLSNFFQNTFFGKLLIILDLVAVTGVLAFIASIKSKFL